MDVYGCLWPGCVPPASAAMSTSVIEILTTCNRLNDLIVDLYFLCDCVWRPRDASRYQRKCNEQPIQGIHCTKDRRALLSCWNSMPGGGDRFGVSASRLQIIARLCFAAPEAHPPPQKRTIPAIDINLRFNKLIRYIAADVAAARADPVISRSRRRRDYEMRYDVPATRMLASRVRFMCK